MIFDDRREAGKFLAAKLAKYTDRADVIVLGLPRGGVPVAFEVAHSLHVPLDVFVVRKLGLPGHEEFAIGAIATGGVRVVNEQAVRRLGIPEKMIDALAEEAEGELQRREKSYRGKRAALSVAKRIVILVDDGLATGATMRAAIQALRQQQPARIVVAVPVGAPETCAELQEAVDEVICARTPDPFYAVGLWYADFTQTSDAEVRRLLEQAVGE